MKGGLTKHVKEAFYILDEEKKKLLLLIFFFILSSLLDLVGIGLIAPYIGLIINSESFVQSDFYLVMISIGLPSDKNYLLLALGFLLVLVFFLKALSSIYINREILRFCMGKGVSLRLELMNIYQNTPYVDYIQRNSSEYIYNIQQLAVQYSHTYLQSVLRLASEGIVGIVILSLLAWNNIYALGLLVILLGGLMIVYDHIFKTKVQEYGVLSNSHSTRMVQGIYEGVGGLKELRILGRENRGLDKSR